MPQSDLRAEFGTISVGDGSHLFTFRTRRGAEYSLTAPSFEIEGSRVSCVPTLAAVGPVTTLSNGVEEHVFSGPVHPDSPVSLKLVVRSSPRSSVVRFRFELSSKGPLRLTKSGAHDAISYFGFSFPEQLRIKEITLGEFHEVYHSHCLTERSVSSRDFDAKRGLMGPLLVAESARESFLFGYEHGSQVPDAFLAYELDRSAPASGSFSLNAVKGNYFAGQRLDREGFSSVWFQFAVKASDERGLASAYRKFVLSEQCTNQESRKPYVYYNTWAYQERNKHWNGNQFLTSMTEERILAEIDVAHRMGIDVFVIDTGWFGVTGDWEVDPKRFQANLKVVRDRLESYGMKLGVWFAPNLAAKTSKVLQHHQASITSLRGKRYEPHDVWETPSSYRVCLASDYWETFAARLIQLYEQVGVRYFKWDGIDQYGCDSPNHAHGGESNSEQERAECYSFQMGRRMLDIVEKLTDACPEAIVDFDITEARRFVGLGFLSVGKYFLINNGPYYHNYDLPNPKDGWINIFVRPGPARGWICRAPLTYDRWIPSVLFLTHYLPDDPEASQLVNIASLILGQNGIWGDLLNVSEPGVELFGKWLGRYKQVRDDVTRANPVRSGNVGGDPEVHEKLDVSSGRGAVVLFANAPGTYTYALENSASEMYVATDGIEVKHHSGVTHVSARFDGPGAQFVLFGVRA